MQNVSDGELIARAYDLEWVRTVGEYLIQDLISHLQRTRNGLEPVQRWVPPAENIKLADATLDDSVSLDRLDPSQLSAKFRELLTRSLGRGQNLQHPQCLGHQVPPPLPLAALFELATTLTNQVQGVYEMGPWAVSVERAVLNRVGEMIGFTPGSFSGLITAGGSLANMTALLTARNVALAESWKTGIAAEGAKPVLVTHWGAHYCINRAAGILGLGTDQVVHVSQDGHGRMDVAALDQTLRELRGREVPIVAVVAVAGSTATGVFDPLNSIADICQQHTAWLHVDAAHGGGTVFSKRHRHLVAGLERADSLICDAHKLMFMPAVCAMVFYRNPAHRFATFQQSAPYLFDPSAPDMAEYDNGIVTFECTKRAAAIGLWGVWSLFGPSLFAALVDRTFAIAHQFHELLRQQSDFETVAATEGNIVVYRHVPQWLSGSSPEALDTFQLTLRRHLLQSGKAYIVQTLLRGRIYLRSAIMNPLIEQEDLDQLIEIIRKSAIELGACASPVE